MVVVHDVTGFSCSRARTRRWKTSEQTSARATTTFPSKATSTTGSLTTEVSIHSLQKKINTIPPQLTSCIELYIFWRHQSIPHRVAIGFF